MLFSHATGGEAVAQAVPRIGSRVAVIGPPGSGKSWLSVRLGDVLMLPVYHLDLLYWNKGWVATPGEEFISRQEKIANTDAWIIDGNYSRSIDFRLYAADTILFLDMSRVLCICRVLRRMITGGSRPDMTEGCRERLDAEFLRLLRSILHYPRRSGPLIERLRGLAGEKEVIRLTSRRQVKGLLSALHRRAQECGE